MQNLIKIYEKYAHGFIHQIQENKDVYFRTFNKIINP